MLLQECIDLKLNLVFAGKQLDEVDGSSYLGSYISLGGCLSDETSSLIQKIRLVITDLKQPGVGMTCPIINQRSRLRSKRSILI